jgi:EAL domain-containing protein (putative c-di-GMP-specific phosphodiesterase class I)
MKSFTWKLAIAFIVSYVILVVVVVFSYTRISQNFIYTQARNNLDEQGDVIALRLDTQLDFDYSRIETLIDTYESAGQDPLTQLQDQTLSLTVLNDTFRGFGSLNGRVLTVGGNTYTYMDSYEFVDFMQPVAVYTFKDAFGTVDETPYIFFMFDDIVGYFAAEPYIDTIFAESNNALQYALITADNRLTIRSFEGVDYGNFYDYIRYYGGSDNTIDQIKDALLLEESITVQTPFVGMDSFLSFNPLNEKFSTKQFYFVQSYSVDTIIDSMSYLTNILWALFFVIFVIFAGAMLIVYKILETKMHDIENARITHYYAKPYIVRVNRLGKIRSYNQSFRKLLGDYDIYDEVKDFEIKKEFDMEAIQDILQRQRAFTAIFELGLQRLVYVRFIPVKTSGGYLLIGDDVSHIEGAFDEYRNMALYNKRTHLPNTNSLKSDLQTFFNNPEDLKRKNALIALDVMSFEKIKSLIGEKSGDRFLIIISELIDESLEGYPATLYNLDEEHYVILMRDIENYNWVTRWVNKILGIFDKPITIDKNFIDVEIRLGIFNIETEKYEILNADTAYDNMMLALNHAKESTQHKFFTYDVTLSLVASRDQRMEADLAVAIKNQEFYMVLQPQYDTQAERLVGFEALIRWNNPKYASESPLKFIQMAERNNMIIDIGRIVLHETFQIAKELEPYNIHISLNVSPVQILQAGFVNELISIFEQYELKKHTIAIEITETFLIGSFDLVITKLKLLQNYGFDIYLDDFGTGYSSLQYLKQLPINTIKIDRAFVIHIETDAHSRAIVQMISSIAKNIGLNVVTEGIETEKQNQLVFKAGCHLIQGYIISPPVVKSEAIRLIREYNIDKTKKVEAIKVRKDVKR